ncbi:IMPACT family protein [Aestuariimicrobium ganziense]|uniref:IMPACT family protein n=1 Tax=Aestuariimicrobium ganziense TaxID=2773677 RepID=UPI002E2DDCFC|nr:YigZ family protein [Aestuariimicrobium ganziense]
MTSYRRLAGSRPVITDLEVKRSTFRCALTHVTSEGEARAAITAARRAHHDAGHHCSAFVLGPLRDQQRSSDDGEPAGTAGIPMLEALLRHGAAAGEPPVTDVVAVVTRWFGGTKLGAGGLTRAYSESVNQTLDVARWRLVQQRRLLEATVAMADLGRVQNVLITEGFTPSDTRFTADSAVLTLAVVDDQDEHLRALLARLTHGTAGVVETGVDWG